MGYQYIRHRCSNAAWARVVSLRVAASTTDQCVVTKAGASETSSRWLLSLAAIDLTLEKSAQTLQEIIRKAASGAGLSLTRLSHLEDDQADCREQDRGSYDFEMFPGLSFLLLPIVRASVTIDTFGCARFHPFGNGKPQKRAGPAHPGAAEAVEMPGATRSRARDTPRTGVPGPNSPAEPTKGSSQSTPPWGAYSSARSS